MPGSRRRVACSVDERVLSTWEGASLRELLGEHRPEVIGDVGAGRARVLNAGADEVELDHEIAEGEVFVVVPVLHPGYKPI